MPSVPLGSANPALLALCQNFPIPHNASQLPVHITKWGETGPRVFMIHGGVQGGIGGGPSNFSDQRFLVDKGWRLELIDRPGFENSPSRGPDDMEADAVLISDLIGDSCHLIGHSFGGAEALLVAARRPEAVRSLVLIEPALQPLVYKMPAFMNNPAAKAAGDVVMKYVMTAKTPAEFSLTFLQNLGRAENGEDNFTYVQIAGDNAKATALGSSLLQSRLVSPQEMLDAAEIVRTHGIPTLVISGGYSEGQEITAKAVTVATGGEHVVVDCASHFVQQANPEKFNAVVDAFMWKAESRRVA